MITLAEDDRGGVEVALDPTLAPGVCLSPPSS
jgi:hypothetical protein